MLSSVKTMRFKHLLVWLVAVACALSFVGAYPTAITQQICATRAYYGDVSDGNGTFDGSATPTGVTKNSSTQYTLTRDRYGLTDTVSTGITVSTVGYRWFADTIILTGTASINNAGGAASGLTAGIAAPSNAIAGGTAGGNGASGAVNGSPGTNQVGTVYGNLSGAGGAGGNDTQTGGAAGTVTTLGNNYGGVRAAPFSILAQAVGSAGTALVYGGTGGGGGASIVADSGGGGGGGGGLIIVSCRSLQGSGSIVANGGAGGNAVTSGGGGGGGGGGVIFLNVGDYSQWSGTTNVAGGAHGTPAGAGATGSAGSAGTVVTLWG